MSLDEFARRKGQGKFVTILTGLDKSSLLEVIDSHKSEDIITVLKQQPLEDVWKYGEYKIIKQVYVA